MIKILHIINPFFVKAGRFKVCFFLFILIKTNIIFSQDIHFSQFNTYPLYLNPAMTGNFYGDYRFNAIYRSQWASVTKPYSTFAVSADSKNLGLKNLGLGIHFIHDVAGDGRFRTIDFMLSSSYQFFLTKKKVHCITPGIQFGLNYRQIDLSKLTFDKQFDGWKYNPNLPNGETFQTSKKSNFNLNLGIVYEWKKDARRRFLFGYSVSNITQPNQTFFGNKQIRRKIRHTIHIEGQFKVAKNWDFIPRFFTNFQGKYAEIITGIEGRYIIKKERGEYMAAYTGVYYRFKDAVYLTFSFDYNNWKAGFSYDMNFSQLTAASSVRGGFEISLQYILKTFKPKKIRHRVCPDFI